MTGTLPIPTLADRWRELSAALDLAVEPAERATMLADLRAIEQQAQDALAALASSEAPAKSRRAR